MLATPNRETAARVRGFLHDAGYSDAALQASLGAAPQQPQQGNLALFLQHAERPSTLRTLLTWFLGGLPLARVEAEATVPAWFREFGVSHGLLTCDDDVWRPRLLLLPRQHLWIAADRYHRDAAETPADHVLAPGPTARALLSGTLPVASARTLDLATGCGVLAFHAAVRSEAVVATDLNARATAFARFGARLNDLENIDCRVGDAYTPVAGERFDHILCNPPFVMSPASTFIYRDNPMLLDAFVRELARGAVEHLADGGFFQMVCEWAEMEDEPWRERVSAWFQDIDCDVWVMHGTSRDAAGYAHARTRELALPTPQDEIALFDEWMAHYRKHRLCNVHGGLVTLRRRDGANWLRIDDASEDASEDFGATLLAGFQARDFVERASRDRSLLDARLRLSPDLVLLVNHRPGPGSWEITSIEARVANALAPHTSLDATAAEFLRLFDGTRTVNQVIDELAQHLGMATDVIHADSVQKVSSLVEHGFLVTG